MKKLWVLLFLFTFVSCATLKHVEPELISYEIDFSKYFNKEFLFSPEKYNGEYLMISIYNLESFPEANYVASYWEIEKVDLDDMFEKIYTVATEKGGNAFVNFKIEEIEKRIGGEDERGNAISNPVTITGYKINGYIIKRN